ncbi:MAG: ABC transporter ATP-binding protein/permease, partial [Anaerolineales bacterium]|nr:ABC transporter ATP-binding protein/permease [Anaerolineales bacterium]
MKSLFKLRSYLKPYFWKILLNLFILLVITGLALVVPYILKGVVDEGLLKGETRYLVNAALLLLGLGLTTAVLNFFQRYLSEWVAAHIGYDLRNAMYDRIQYLSFSYHDHAQTGQLITRCIEDVRAIQNFAGGSIIEIIQLVFVTVGVMAALFTADVKLAVIAILPLIPMLMMAVDFGDRVTKLFYKVDLALGDISTRLQENVSGVQVVRAFAREAYETRRFEEVNQAYFKSRVVLIGEWSKVMPTTNLLIALGTILILIFGGQDVLAGRMTIGEVVAFNSFWLMLSAPVQQLAWLVNAAGEAGAGAQRALEILETEPAIQSPKDAAVVPALRGRVEFRNVSLKYQNEKSVALSNIELTVEPNQLVALIGQTGSGKTSLVNLIPRFYDVTEGALLVDGRDVRALDLASFRRQIGIVLQTSLLFSDTIRANIAYGRPDAGEAEIVAAARAAQ